MRRQRSRESARITEAYHSITYRQHSLAVMIRYHCDDGEECSVREKEKLINIVEPEVDKGVALYE